MARSTNSLDFRAEWLAKALKAKKIKAKKIKEKTA